MKDCNSCGKCCIKYSNGGLSATFAEIEFWQAFRPDIYRYVKDSEIWISPESGRQIVRCPWLRKVPDENKYLCDIYNDRPDDCRHYPVTVDDMINDECEMLEVKDLANPKQAQKILDQLMADSRPW